MEPQFISYLYGNDWITDKFWYEINKCVCDGGGFPWHNPSECILMIPFEGWNCE